MKTYEENKDSFLDIYEDIDRFLCHRMNSSEEKKFLEMVSKETKILDKTAIIALMIKAIFKEGKKADSGLLDTISKIPPDD